MIFKLYFEEM